MMETEVVMRRELFGDVISQKSKSEFFSVTDLVRAGNKWRLKNDMEIFNLNKWFQNKATKDFVSALESQFGEVKINSTGKNRHTWVHPFLFIDIALAISPELKIECYKWLYDELLNHRNNSGDSYKLMCGALYENCSNKSSFAKSMILTANYIKKACRVSDWNYATSEQLELRNKIQENIALLTDVLKDNNQAIRLGIIKTIKQ